MNKTQLYQDIKQIADKNGTKTVADIIAVLNSHGYDFEGYKVVIQPNTYISLWWDDSSQLYGMYVRHVVIHQKHDAEEFVREAEELTLVVGLLNEILLG